MAIHGRISQTKTTDHGFPVYNGKFSSSGLEDKFLQFTGCSGMHIIPLKPAGDYSAGRGDAFSGLTDREAELRQIHGIVECIAARHTANDAVFYFDGRALRKVSHEKAAMLARQYLKQVRSAWGLEREGG